MSRTWKEALPDGIKTDYLMNQQARTGVYFDQEKAREVWEYCNERMLQIEKEVEPHLPTRELNKGEQKEVTPPVRQQRMGKDGLEPSSYMLKFKERMLEDWNFDLDISNLPLPEKPVLQEGKMKLKHQDALKQYLMTKWGWRPTLWNFKKNSKGKMERDSKGQPIKTSPKFHQGGQLCPNLEILGEIADIVKPIVEWLSLRNRRSVIWNPEKNSGWLEHPRLKKDGRLPAGCSGLTYTHRQKHKVVANIPRVTSTLGKEMRALFCAPEGRVLVGYDASSLEAVVKGHYAFRYPGGEDYYKKITDPNFDEHQETADAWGLASRQDAKAGNYGLTQ